MFDQVGHDLFDGFFDTGLIGADMDLRVVGRLVGCADAGEVWDAAGTRLLVEPLGVALLAYFQRRIHENLEKIVFFARRQVAGHVAVLPVGRDECAQVDQARVAKELGHFADAANILDTVFRTECEIAVQAGSHIVAVQAIGPTAHVIEPFLERYRQRGFARAGQAGKPDRKPPVLVKQFTVLTADRTFVPDDVRAFAFGHSRFLHQHGAARAFCALAKPVQSARAPTSLAPARRSCVDRHHNTLKCPYAQD